MMHYKWLAAKINLINLMVKINVMLRLYFNLHDSFIDLALYFVYIMLRVKKFNYIKTCYQTLLFLKHIKGKDNDKQFMII